jgi:dTMP kinase
MKGFFITFEGIEGSGKTTQIKLLDEYLRRLGYKTILTREPGGTPIGERIRDILLDAENHNMSSEAELFLYAASRNQHIHEKILPALSDGAVVLCDRYSDATEAYQGAARKIDMAKIRAVHEIATSGLMPDITFLTDCPAALGLGRARKRNAADKSLNSMDRFEREELDFHERVRQGYLAIAKREPHRVKVVDASKGEETMHRDVVAAMEAFLKKARR